MMKKALYKIWSKFLSIFGDIKVFKWPLFCIYDPDDYQVGGHEVIDIMKILKPCDIILRGYRHYLDGKFINIFGIDTSKTAFGGDWSHGALYIGNNKVIHAIAEGVSETNVVDFTRCDRIAIFRASKYQTKAIQCAKKFLKENVPYDFSFENGASSLYCFELAALSYSKLNIPKFDVNKLFGLIKKEQVFLAQSFLNSEDLKLVYCYNPKYKIINKKFK